MSSESESESEFDSDFELELKAQAELLESKLFEFLQNFSPISLHHTEPKSDDHLWVFFSESEGCENISYSADLGTIHENIISALSNICFPMGFRNLSFFCQFWAPVTIEGRRLLSTSAQPFAVSFISNELAMFRLNSEKYKYNIDDENKPNIEPDYNMIKSGGPATAFLNCRTSMTELEFNDLSQRGGYGMFNIMLPICFPSQSNCVGVLEFTLKHEKDDMASFLFDTVNIIKKAGMDVFNVHHLIPYETINGLKVTKDEIEEALKVVCATHNLTLAQVWIVDETKNNVFSYSLEDSQTKQLSAIKLTGYLAKFSKFPHTPFKLYFELGDVTTLAIGEAPAMVTLQDCESRYVSSFYSTLVRWYAFEHRVSVLAICLRSNVTGDFNYAFEFIWTEQSNYIILLEAIILTLKTRLPRFKFASGAELGDELDVILVASSTNDREIGETQKFKIFQEKRSSPMSKALEKGNNPMVVDLIAPSKVTYKTFPKVLPQDVVKKQFGKTMKEAAKNLNVSVSTLKRKCKDLGISEWPGPSFVKRNAIGPSIIQNSTNEEDDGATEETPTVNLNKNVLTLKAKYTDYMIKLHLPISQATFVTVEERIGMKLNLSVGTFKLEYIDEDEDWISLTSDTDMNDCIKSSRKSDRIVARLRVLPSHKTTTNIRS